jgi:hypothetical protein
MTPAQFVDPSVSRFKFDYEIELFRDHEADYRMRGWNLQRATFPKANVLMAAPQLKPPAVVLGVQFDYSNYDAAPPSVKLVDPFTWEPYKAKDLPTALNRQAPVQDLAAQGVMVPGGAGPQVRMFVPQPLMQWYGPEDLPFLCLPGVREYHEHPGHTGDSWELHRPLHEGRLVHLLEVIHRFGVAPIAHYNVGLLPQINGFGVSQIPE